VTLADNDQLFIEKIHKPSKSSTHRTYLAPCPIKPSFLLSPPTKTAVIFLIHSRTVHLDIIKVFYLPTDAQENCFKKNIKIHINLYRTKVTFAVTQVKVKGLKKLRPAVDLMAFKCRTLKVKTTPICFSAITIIREHVIWAG
jgi:hypothetical protein